MVKWFGGRWNPSRGFRVMKADLDRAKQNIDKFDYVLFTDRLGVELPIVAKYVNYTKTPKQVRVME